MTIPTDLLYAPTHEWIRIEGDEAIVGITHFAQEQLGDITFIDLPAVGSMLVAGEEMGAVESVKAASEINSPINGQVIAVNTELDSQPELVNESAYEKGWMLRVKFEAPIPALLSDKEYEAAIQE